MTNFLELIIYGSVAGLVIYRLYTKLGRDDNGHKRDHRESLLHKMYTDRVKKHEDSIKNKQSVKSNKDVKDNSVAINAHVSQNKFKRPVEEKDINDFSSAKLTVLAISKPVLEKYKLISQSFDEMVFLKASVSVFGLVYSYFSEGNVSELKNLLNKDVAKGFEDLIHEKNKANQRWDFEVLNIKSAKISKAELKENIATLTVVFSSERVEAIYNSEGRIVNKSSPNPFIASDQWTFVKDLTSPNPEWYVNSTKSL